MMAYVDELRHMLARTSWWAAPRTWVLRDPDLIRARKTPFEYSAGVLANLAPGGLYLLRTHLMFDLLRRDSGAGRVWILSQAPQEHRTKKESGFQLRDV